MPHRFGDRCHTKDRGPELHCIDRTGTAPAVTTKSSPCTIPALHVPRPVAIDCSPPLALMALSAPAGLSAGPTGPSQHFDAFIHHVRTRSAVGGCRAHLWTVLRRWSFVQEEGCRAPSASKTSWELEAQRFGWKATGRDVARYRGWLRLWLTTDGTMTNLQARACGTGPPLMDITGRPREVSARQPGLDGEVIAVLDRGTLPGASRRRALDR